MYLNLGANISRNKKLQEENNFCETIKILWTYKTSVHKATVTGNKDNNFQITSDFKHSTLSFTNIKSKQCFWRSKTNTGNYFVRK